MVKGTTVGIGTGSMTILDELAAHARERVAAARDERPLERLMAEAQNLTCDTGFPFERALRREARERGIAFICECKRASPSRGLIAPDFPCLDIAREYEAAGAAAISVLTEPRWFLGSDGYLREIAAAVSVPCLRKDFIVDEYMIWEAKLLGASAVLLIVSLLDAAALARYIGLCDSLGLSALVEAHDGEEVRSALDAGARAVGVNNRDLRDFSVDMGNSGRLRELVPQETLFVAESGIRTPEDVAALLSAGADAVLVGEALMRAPDKKAALDSLRGVPGPFGREARDIPEGL